MCTWLSLCHLDRAPIHVRNACALGDHLCEPLRRRRKPRARIHRAGPCPSVWIGRRRSGRLARGRLGRQPGQGVALRAQDGVTRASDSCGPEWARRHQRGTCAEAHVPWACSGGFRLVSTTRGYSGTRQVLGAQVSTAPRGAFSEGFSRVNNQYVADKLDERSGGGTRGVTKPRSSQLHARHHELRVGRPRAKQNAAGAQECVQ